MEFFGEVGLHLIKRSADADAGSFSEAVGRRRTGTEAERLEVLGELASAAHLRGEGHWPVGEVQLGVYADSTFGGEVEHLVADIGHLELDRARSEAGGLDGRGSVLEVGDGFL